MEPKIGSDKIGSILKGKFMRCPKNKSGAILDEPNFCFKLTFERMNRLIPEKKFCTYRQLISWDFYCIISPHFCKRIYKRNDEFIVLFEKIRS